MVFIDRQTNNIIHMYIGKEREKNIIFLKQCNFNNDYFKYR